MRHPDGPADTTVAPARPDRRAPEDEPDVVEALAIGPPVVVRQMHSDDAGRLVELHAQLSDETTYRRYFTVHRTLRPHEVEWFTQVDHRDREAFVATSEGEIVGVGRYDRNPGAAAAEAAFVVRDDWQGLGLGPVLLRHVAEHARRVGVTTLTAETLSINGPMLSVFRRSGYPMTTTTLDGVTQVELDLSGVD